MQGLYLYVLDTVTLVHAEESPMHALLRASLFVAIISCAVQVTDAGAAERDAAPSNTAPPTAKPPSPATDAVPFKCSPRTQRCNCSGRSGCSYMKETIGASCGKITCTGTGSKQKCQCTVHGS